MAMRRDTGFGMAKERRWYMAKEWRHTGYVANILAGMLFGALAGFMISGPALFVDPRWFLIGGLIGAVVGGTGGGLWVFRNRRKTQSRSSEDAKTGRT
jgi:hypothetical protein